MRAPAHRWIMIGLAALLLGTNSWWLYREAYATVDQLSIMKYQQMGEHDMRETAKAALLAMPAIASQMPKAELVQRVAEAVGESDPFEKDGITVVGWLSLRFGDDERLVEARSVFTPDIVFGGEASP